MKQTHFYPDYMKDFCCIAAQCPDSCCVGWQIVVDDASAERYADTPGEVGEMLRDVMEIDADGDRVFRLRDDGNCPFFRSDGLCEMHCRLGADALCETCRNFPRIQQNYVLFVEHGLSLSCPEAARLIFSAEHLTFTEVEVDVPDEECAYDVLLMHQLLDARKKLYHLLCNEKQTMGQNLTDCLLYAAQVQDDIDGNGAMEEAVPCLSALECGTPEGFFVPFDEMEVLSEEWRQLLLAAREAPGVCTLEEDVQNTFFSRNMLFDYLYRYFLQAIADGNVLGKVKLMVTAYLMLRRMQQAYVSRSGEMQKEPMQTETIRYAQLFSKEVAHSDINCAILDDAFDFLDSYTLEQFAALLRCW